MTLFFRPLTSCYHGTFGIGGKTVSFFFALFQSCCVHLKKNRGTPPVDADGTQVEDAGRAHHDVQSEEDVTVN